MAGLQPNNNEATHQKLKEFLALWTLDKVKQMTLEDYSDVGSKETFCYWIEFETEELGRIGGKPSNKFGIWKRKTDKAIVSEDFLFDKNYAWYKKYGKNPQEAFASVKNHVISIIENSQSGNFKAIDGIDLDSLARWKIAFLYSNNSLMPIYKNEVIRKIARHFKHPNFEKARLSDLHIFIVKQRPDEEDFFDWAWKQFVLAEKEFTRNYYIIGSKYEDDNGKDTVSILEYMLKRNVIATGFFWGTDFSKLYKHSYQRIYKWCDENIANKSGKYVTAKRTLGYFLQLRPGDIVAVKSHGQFGNLTIIAYAEVKEIEGKVYEPDGDDFPDGLGQIVHVEFLETSLWVDTGLSYGQTIHQIIPGEKEGHFEKIFGSYSSLENSVNENEIINDEEEEVVASAEEDRINEKQTEASYREVSYTTLVSKTHNKIQIAFAKFLKKKFPNDIIRTETSYIDVKRENPKEVYIYEVKPYNSAYSCIRAGIGQLMDYCHSNPNKSKTVHLRIVGTADALPNDLKFIEFVKSNLNLSFDYIAFNHLTEN
jgi:hypothetical protein